MGTIALLTCNFLLATTLLGGQRPLPPVTLPAPSLGPERPHPALPIDQPPVVVHGSRRHSPDLAEMKKQAAELSNLAQSVPPDIDRLGKGELPKDLKQRLKKITKLSRKLSREVSE